MDPDKSRPLKHQYRDTLDQIFHRQNELRRNRRLRRNLHNRIGAQGK